MTSLLATAVTEKFSAAPFVPALAWWILCANWSNLNDIAPAITLGIPDTMRTVDQGGDQNREDRLAAILGFASTHTA
jgi:hypothetical protein